MTILLAQEIIRQYEEGEIIHFTSKEYSHLRRSTEKTSCEERMRGSGPKFVRVGRKVLYPCVTTLDHLGIEASVKGGKV